MQEGLQAMTCRNICERYGIKIPKAGKYGKVISPYRLGLRYCSRCQLYFDTSLFFCICCGLHLRLNPLNKKYKVVSRY